MVQVSRTASLCSRTYQPKHRSGMSDLVTLSCWGAVLSGLGKFHWPDLDLVPGSVGVAYGDRRPQWAWSRSAVKQSRSRTVLWPITQYPSFYTTQVKTSLSVPAVSYHDMFCSEWSGQLKNSNCLSHSVCPQTPHKLTHSKTHSFASCQARCQPPELRLKKIHSNRD